MGVSFAKRLGLLDQRGFGREPGGHCGPAAGDTAPRASGREVDRAVLPGQSRATSRGVACRGEERVLRSEAEQGKGAE